MAKGTSRTKAAAAPPPRKPAQAPAGAPKGPFEFPDLMGDEIERLNVRRQVLGIVDAEGDNSDAGSKTQRVGLALSGGGIRSATFSLGVLQALSRSHCLPRIDYLSTVSGGSYMGSFFGALFVRPERRGGKARTDAEHLAFLRDPLGGPLGTHGVKNLRESGRYLTPAGTSDAFYGAAIVMRNWTALQLVIGSVAFLLFWVLMVADKLWGQDLPWTPQAGRLGLSPILAALILCALATVMAFGTAYWLTKREWIEGGRIRRVVQNGFFWLMLALSIVVLSPWLPYLSGLKLIDVSSPAREFFAAFAGVVSTLAIVSYGITEAAYGGVGKHKSDPNHLIAAEDQVRTKLSRAMASALVGLFVLIGLALASALGELLARTIIEATIQIEAAIEGTTKPNTNDWWVTISQRWVPALTAAAPVVLTIASHIGLKRGGTEGRLYKLSLSMPTLMSLMGIALLGLWLLLWSAAAHATQPLFDSRSGALALTIILLVVLAVLSACYSFINLSSLSTFYASRLQRAYIGASTPHRPFGSDRDFEGDRIGVQAYYAEDNHAPVHLINVTIAQTQQAKSNIIAYDRKGKPMHLSPSGIVFEGDSPGEAKCLKRLEGEELPLANWVAISGAAASSAIGSGTSFGLSVLATLANVRLGYWWKRLGSRRVGFFRRLPGSLGDTVQAYLLNELRGRFIGTAQRRWYLTDGGHFENTGAYALIQRRVPYIIVSDNGADPNYQFDDIVRLVNRAQNDLGVKIEFLSSAQLSDELGDGALRDCFGTYQELSVAPKPKDDIKPFATLARVHYPELTAPGRLLVIKPRLTFREPPELLAYHNRAGDSAFPQQTTADQFFDEEQWEAYRRLGELIGEQLFGATGKTGKWWPSRDLR